MHPEFIFAKHLNLASMKSKLLFFVLTGCVFAEIDSGKRSTFKKSHPNNCILETLSAKLDDLFKRSFNFNPDYEDGGAGFSKPNVEKIFHSRVLRTQTKIADDV